MTSLHSCQIVARSLTTRALLRSLPPRFTEGLAGTSSLNSSRHLSSSRINDEPIGMNSDSDHIWENMNEKTRSLATLLLDHDTSSRSGDDGRELKPQERASHVFDRRRGLSQAITMIESQKPEHQRQSNLLLTYLLGHENNHIRKANSFRLGIAGPPGAGKSTFVESFGKYLLNFQKHDSGATVGYVEDTSSPSLCQNLAVVCIDPSSAVTGGSILGDKTRMTELSRHQRAYVRPSPTKTVLGGLAAYTEDVVSLCQVAGYDFVIVETVGLGQSEIEVKESVDLLMLMVPPGGGDDLQGIKKGIVEVSDMVVITKADGKFLEAARSTASDYSGALRMMPRSGLVSLPGWKTPPVVLVSSHDSKGLENVWKKICLFRSLMIESGELGLKRQRQASYWMWKNVQNLILLQTKSDPALREKAQVLEELLAQGKTTPRVAATELLESLVRQ